LAEKKKIMLDYTIQPKCSFAGDPHRLAELVACFIENAIKYTPDGKSVSVILEKRDDTATLKVIDTGIGIAEIELKNIFNRFYRTKNSRKITRGIGLGLAICESIVKAHGGVIQVSSVLGKGTTFYAQFPLTTTMDDFPAAKTDVSYQK